MTHVWPLYLAVLIAVIVRSWTADPLLRLSAFVLFGDWLLSNALHWFAAFDYRAMFQFSDLFLAASFLLAWVIFRKSWTVVISAMYAISSLTALFAYESTSRYSFDLALNAAFLARLAVVWISASDPRKAQEPT